MRYDAFISYSHAADGKLAPRLQRALHKLAKPWFKARALTVFRDQTDLSVSPGTWPSIERALKDSKHFVLLASADAARSKWVAKEVAYWLSERDLDSLSLVVTDGEFSWSDEDGRIDAARTTDLPPQLLAAYRQEPLYVDLRSARDDVDLSLQNADFKQRVVPLAARLHGKTPAELVGDEVREHRRTLRIRNAAVSTHVALSILAASAAYVAERHRRSAVEAREASEREAVHARAGELRAMLQRVDALLAAADRVADPARFGRLETERVEVERRLVEATHDHQRRLAAAIGFRGDLDFLIRFEGHAGTVKLIGNSVFIDPATDLAFVDRETIEKRYEMLLTPDELDAVLRLVKLKGEPAKQAWTANPILERVRFAEADVARLVPEVAAPFWRQLVARFPSLADDSTPPAAQTALLSLAFNRGMSKRVWGGLADPIARGDWPAAAAAVDAMAGEPMHTRFPGLQKRRHQEAALLRGESVAAE
jgi:GH24 family phage-related lysozyme (muramidase)